MSTEATQRGGVDPEWGRTPAQNAGVTQLLNTITGHVTVSDPDPDTGTATVQGAMGTWTVDVHGNTRRV